MFLEAIYASSTHHVSPRIHHVFTIQKPHPNTQLSQNPLKKPSKATEKDSTNPPDFFFVQTTAFSE
jgi:hypothetical protein